MTARWNTDRDRIIDGALVFLALIPVVLAISLCLDHLHPHRYRWPSLQTVYLRVIFMVPV